MRHFLEFARREDFERLVDRAVEFEAVHGVAIEIDPLWLGLWRTSRAGPRHLKDSPRRFWDFGPPDFSHGHSHGPIDPSWRCDMWEKIASGYDGETAEPYLIKVLVFPETSDGEITEIHEQLGDVTSNFRLRYEHRPVARLYGAHEHILGGTRIRGESDQSATLGGLVEERTGRRFGVTCGHAVTRGQRVRFAMQPGDGVEELGRCVVSRALDGPTAGLCNRRCATNDADVALIELSGSVKSDLLVRDIGKIERWTLEDDVCEESPVEVSSASGHRNLYTAGLFALGSILVNGHRYCFRDLIQLKRTSADYWGATGTFSPPVRPGDSGAWVIQHGRAGPEWCGTVIGGGGPVGLAVFSQRVVRWLEAEGFDGLRSF